MDAFIVAIPIFVGLMFLTAAVDRVVKAIAATACVFYVALSKEKQGEADALIKAIMKGES